MRIAFYAPLKPPTHETPSGDRRMARLLMQALSAAAHDVSLASSFRSYDSSPDGSDQSVFKHRGETIAHELIRDYEQRPASQRPEAWFTYHVYYRAPDWLGPAISRRLGIPYLIAEPSYAPKRAGGAWHIGHQATAVAIAAADAVFYITALDVACVRPLVGGPERLHHLPPFLDSTLFASHDREDSRRALAAACGLAGDRPWLLAVGMMRRGDKLASYAGLATALRTLADCPWQLVIVGDGEARGDVDALFADFPPDRVRPIGARAADELPQVYAACDIYVWPAVNEAYGMALLEAQAAGMPVVAGNIRGVPDVVREGETGILTPAGDVPAFAAGVRRLLKDRTLRQTMGRRAQAFVTSERTLTQAAERLDRALREAVAARAPTL